MDPSLQNKVNLLALLVIAFTLLAIPVFSQVKADTRESVKQVPDTLFVKWGRDIASQLRPEDFQDVQVEDSWYEQAKNQNPACGPECDPNGDFDGDGMSNQEELERGRNPACNEDQLGEQRCRNEGDKFNLTEPVKGNESVPYRIVLFNQTWNSNMGSSQSSYEFSTNGTKFDRFEFVWSAEWGNEGFFVWIVDPNEVEEFYEERAGDPLSTSMDSDGGTASYDLPADGVHSVQFSASGFAPTSLTGPAQVELLVVGVVDGSD